MGNMALQQVDIDDNHSSKATDCSIKNMHMTSGKLPMNLTNCGAMTSVGHPDILRVAQRLKDLTVYSVAGH